MEQLVLYVKALRALNLSLLFAQGEISVGHLKPSNSVKNGKKLIRTRIKSDLTFYENLLIGQEASVRCPCQRVEFRGNVRAFRRDKKQSPY